MKDLPEGTRVCGEGNISWFPERQVKLVEFLKQIKPVTILETGFNMGHSAHLICQTIHELKKKCSDYSKVHVDFYIFDICEHECVRHNFEILKSYWRDCVSLHLTEGDSAKTLPDFASRFQGRFDFAEIDGNHTFDGVQNDIRSVVGRMEEGGVIYVDDYKSSKFRFEGLDAGVDEFSWEGFEIGSIDGLFWAVKNQKKCDLLVHNPNSDFMRGFRDNSVFWDEIIAVLSESCNVIENRGDATTQEDLHIHLSRRTRDHLQVKNCEMVIENLDTGDFYVLSLADQISPAVLAEQDNPHLKTVFYSQYVPDQILFHTGKNAHKYRPWIYFPQNSADFDGLYAKRQDMAKLKEKMYFKGTREYRPIIGHIDPSLLSDNGGLGHREYLEEMMGYRLALSIGGAANGDICYRDVECMALGVPMIRFEYVIGLDPNLIPNYHYFSIPLPDDLPLQNAVKKDRLGLKRHAEMIEQRFREVVGDLDYLNFVSNNARRYYEENLSSKVRARNTLLKLGLIK